VTLRTKIVCTLGPASSSEEIIRGLVSGGLDVARINMSHGTHEEHATAIRLVREVSSELERPVAILADLAGPKIRVGHLPHAIRLVPGVQVTVAPQASATGEEIPTTFADLAEALSPGNRMLLDDGLMELEVIRIEGDRVVLQVVRGGLLKSRKGINLPEAEIRAPSLTPKDLLDLDFALDQEVEYVGLSFVRKASDVVDLKERVQGRALIVAKIEKASALRAIEEVLYETDAVMVARGDLGVELEFEQVPLAQKNIIRLANFFGRPVITATQMLESMIDFPRPTRAEASDVANAILDGTDAVMLSGETAIGAYPLQALEAIVRIGKEIEDSGVLRAGPRYDTSEDVHERAGASRREHAIASATVESARQLQSPAIIVISRSGFSARLVSSYRPSVPIFALCTEPKVQCQLAAVWGVRPILAKVEEMSYEALTEFGKRYLVETGVGQRGQSVVVTAGYPFDTSGTTNTMRVEQL